MSEQPANSPAERPVDLDSLNEMLARRDAGIDLQADEAAYLQSVADRVNVIKTGGVTIPGTDEWVPGRNNYYLQDVDEEGKPTSRMLTEDVGQRLLTYAEAARQRAQEASAAAEAPQEHAAPEAGAAAEVPRPAAPEAAGSPFDQQPDISTRVEGQSAPETGQGAVGGGEHEQVSLPEDLSDYDKLRAVVAKDGSRRVYGVDADGKQRQVKGDDVLKAYGYDDLETELRREEERQAPEVSEAPEVANVAADWMNQAPKAENMIIAGYTDAEGRPITGATELASLIAEFAAAGNRAEMERAATAFWTSAGVETRRVGRPEKLAEVGAFIAESYRRLEAMEQEIAAEEAAQAANDAIPGLEGVPDLDIENLTREDVDEFLRRLSESSGEDLTGPDEDQGEAAPDAGSPPTAESVEPVPVPVFERGFRGKMRLLGQKMGAKLASIEFGRLHPDTKRKKVLYLAGLAATVAAGAYLAHRFGYDRAPSTANGLELDGGSGAGPNGGNQEVTADMAEVLSGQTDSSQEVAQDMAEAVSGQAQEVNVYEQLNEVVTGRTNEILQAQGTYPWGRAEQLYGDQAMLRLTQAVDRLRANGVDARWVGNYIEVNGASDTDTVWNHLAKALAEQDLQNFFDAQAKQP